MYFNINITTYFRVSLKMKKPMLCCFKWIVFIKLDFAVPFLSIGKTQDDRFAGKGGRMGDFKKWGQILVMEDDFEMGG